MSILLLILGIGSLFSFLVLLLLAVPITLVVRIKGRMEIKGEVNIGWLFGMAKFRIPITGAGKAEPAPIRKSAGKKVKRTARGSASCLISALNRKVFRRRCLRFIKEMLRATHGRDLFLQLRIGLGDPADTGLLWALLGPLAAMAANIRMAEVCIAPDFLDAVLEVEARGRFYLIPLQFIYLIANFVFSPACIRTWWELYRSNAQ